jgi:hypothetical protein
MQIKLDKKIQKEVEEIVALERAYRHSIQALSKSAYEENCKLWKIILRHHPEVKNTGATYNADTGIVTFEEQ